MTLVNHPPATYAQRMAATQDDRESLSQAAGHLATLARCLAVEFHLEKWNAETEAISGGIAADALDQARGLLEELAGGWAQALLDAVERVAATPPSDGVTHNCRSGIGDRDMRRVPT